MVSSKHTATTMHTLAHKIAPPDPSMPKSLRDRHNTLRSMAADYRSRLHARMSTAGKKTGMASRTSTKAFFLPAAGTMANERAPEVCGGLSPQQVNTIKVDLASDLIDKNGPPPHTVLFRKDGRAQLKFSKKIVGVTMEDASSKGNPHAVVATSGLVSLACPAEVAKKFEWGNFVAVRNGAMVASGFDTDQKIALVFPHAVSSTTKKDTKVLGRFAGWPTGNSKDGGVLVLLSLPC